MARHRGTSEGQIASIQTQDHMGLESHSRKCLIGVTCPTSSFLRRNPSSEQTNRPVASKRGSLKEEPARKHPDKQGRSGRRTASRGMVGAFGRCPRHAGQTRGPRPTAHGPRPTARGTWHAWVSGAGEPCKYSVCEALR